MRSGGGVGRRVADVGAGGAEGPPGAGEGAMSVLAAVAPPPPRSGAAGEWTAPAPAAATPTTGQRRWAQVRSVDAVVDGVSAELPSLSVGAAATAAASTRRGRAEGEPRAIVTPRWLTNGSLPPTTSWAASTHRGFA